MKNLLGSNIIYPCLVFALMQTIFVFTASALAAETYHGQVIATSGVDLTKARPFVERYYGQVSSSPNVVRLAGEDMFSINAPAGGFSILERTLIVERNLNNALKAAINRSPSAVTVDHINNIPVVRLDGFHVITADSESAKVAGTTMESLAGAWADSMRRILSNEAKVSLYVASLDGDFITASNMLPYRRARLEAARLNHAAPVFRENVPPGLVCSDSLASDGMKALNNHDPISAEQCFRKAIAIGPDNSRAFYGLGRALLEQGKVDESIAFLQMARWLEPDYALAHIALGQAFETQGRARDAIKQYQEAALLQPDNPEPYLLIADIREDRNDMGKSVVELTNANKLIPDSQYIQLRKKDQLAWRLKRPM